MLQYEEIKVKLMDFIGMHKKWVLSGSICLFIFILLIFNIGLIQVTYYSMTNDTQKIINVVIKEVKKDKDTEKIYVSKGLDYLIEDLSEPSKAFLEKYFGLFSEERQLEILKAYTEKELFFTDHKSLFDKIGSLETVPVIYKNYIKRMDLDVFEHALRNYFGENIVLDQGSVTRIYKIVETYGKKLRLEKFDLDLYELMKFPHKGSNESIAIKLLGFIEPEVIRQKVFDGLKAEAIHLDELSIWIEVFKKNQVITNEEYAAFTNSSSQITQLKEHYKDLEKQEVDLINLKDQVDIQTKAVEVEKEQYIQKNKELEKSVEAKENELARYTNYQTKEVYIMDYYNNNEYEASVPEKSWFFNTYKPSDEKFIIKLNTTAPENQGVYTVDIYARGTHNSGLPYYVEVSSEDYHIINTLKNEIDKLEDEVQNNKNEIAKRDEEISMIRKTQNYEHTLEQIESIKQSQNKVIINIEEQGIKIKNLFGLKEVIIEKK